MKKLHNIALAALAVMCAAGAQAQSQTATNNDTYIEIGYSPIQVSQNGSEATPDAARFLVGVELNKNMAFEAMYVMTSRKESRVGYEGQINGYGLFLKPKMGLTDNTEIFARVGAMRAEITASTSGAYTGNDWAYGLGVQTNFTKSVYGQLDYMTSYNRENVAAKGYALSLGMRF
jgi:opacity protein-like surface antigen